MNRADPGLRCRCSDWSPWLAAAFRLGNRWAGFIGSHLVRKLLSRRLAREASIDDLSSGKTRQLRRALRPLRRSGRRFVELSICDLEVAARPTLMVSAKGLPTSPRYRACRIRLRIPVRSQRRQHRPGTLNVMLAARDASARKKSWSWRAAARSTETRTLRRDDTTDTAPRSAFALRGLEAGRRALRSRTSSEHLRAADLLSALTTMSSVRDRIPPPSTPR